MAAAVAAAAVRFAFRARLPSACVVSASRSLMMASIGSSRSISENPASRSSSP